MDQRIMGMETEYIVVYLPVDATLDSLNLLQRMSVEAAVVMYYAAEPLGNNDYLPNGARLYLDQDVPEYATPECDRPRQAVAHVSAGDSWMRAVAVAAQEQLSAQGKLGRLQLLKSSTHWLPGDYGMHENYLVTRRHHIGQLVAAWTPFLLTRQLLVGGGQFRSGSPGLLSSRSTRIATVMSEETGPLPMVCTRDEPYADPERYQRIQVLVGDPNRSETSTHLKVGSTDLMLQMIESGDTFADLALRWPLKALRDINVGGGGTLLLRAKGGTIRAIDLQGVCLERAEQHFGDAPGETRDVLDLWGRVISAIAEDRLHLIDREIDWVIKAKAAESFDPGTDVASRLAGDAAFDLAYADLAPEGLFQQLEASGGVKRVTSDAEVAEALHTPPSDTRAVIRGRAAELDYFQAQVFGWDRIDFPGDEGSAETLMLGLGADDAALARVTAQAELTPGSVGPERRQFRRPPPPTGSLGRFLAGTKSQVPPRPPQGDEPSPARARQPRAVRAVRAGTR